MTQYIIQPPRPNGLHRAADFARQMYDQWQMQQQREEEEKRMREQEEAERKDYASRLAIQALSNDPQAQYRAISDYGSGSFDPSQYSPAAPQVDPKQAFDDLVYNDLMEKFRTGQIPQEILVQAQAARAAGQPLTDFVYGLSQTPEEAKPRAVAVKQGRVPDADTVYTQDQQNQRQQNQFSHEGSMEERRQVNREAIERLKSTLDTRGKAVLDAQTRAIDQRIDILMKDVKRFQEEDNVEKVNQAKKAILALMKRQDELISKYGAGAVAPAGQPATTGGGSGVISYEDL